MPDWESSKGISKYRKVYTFSLNIKNPNDQYLLIDTIAAGADSHGYIMNGTGYIKALTAYHMPDTFALAGNIDLIVKKWRSGVGDTDILTKTIAVDGSASQTIELITAETANEQINSYDALKVYVDKTSGTFNIGRLIVTIEIEYENT